MKNIMEKAPGIIEGFRRLTSSIDDYSSMELKMKELVLIGMMTATRSLRGIDTHVEICKKAGGTENEILASILYAIPICGIPTVTLAFERALEVLKRLEGEAV